MWSVVLSPGRFTTLVQLQSSIKFNEELLIKLASDDGWPNTRLTGTVAVRTNYQRDQRGRFNKGKQTHLVKTYEASAAAVGSRKKPTGGWGGFKPKFPRDDKVVSTPVTPADRGQRPCFHCGSPFHWDKDCKHHLEDAKRARTMLASHTATVMRAEADYQDAYDTRFDDLADFNTDLESDSDELPNSSEPNSRD